MKRLFIVFLLVFVISGCGEKTPAKTPTQIPTPTLGVGSTQVSPIDEMILVYVPAGEFEMGSEDRHWIKNEQPVHTVYLDAFWIDKYEVTNAQYSLCVENGMCNQPGGSNYENSAYDDHPVMFVSWNDAEDYCAWARRRLPTEAEWEKAARGEDGRTYPWGEGINPSLANYQGNETTPVGSYLDGASPYGVMDMAGNALEWVADWYDEDYYSNSPSENPQGPSSGDYRVLRGGTWLYSVRSVRSTYRRWYFPDDALYGPTIRCALSP